MKALIGSGAGFVAISLGGILVQLWVMRQSRRLRREAKIMLQLHQTAHDDSLRVPFLQSGELSLEADTTDPNFWRGFSVGQVWMAALLARATGHSWQGIGVHEIYVTDCLEMMHRIAESTGTRIVPVDQGNGYFDIEVSKVDE